MIAQHRSRNDAKYDESRIESRITCFRNDRAGLLRRAMVAIPGLIFPFFAVALLFQ